MVTEIWVNIGSGNVLLPLVNGGWGISYEIVLRWMPLDLTDDVSTLAQVMACCLTAPSHHLNQCWPIISEVKWHSYSGNFLNHQPSITKIHLKITCLKFYSNFPGANELIQSVPSTHGGQVLYRYLSKLDHHWFMQRLGALSVPSLYLNQC